MNVIQIGQFTLQLDLIILIGTIVLAGLVMVLRLMLESKSTRLTIDWLITVMIFLVLNMKFGYLWDSPTVIWEQPRALLFLSGTSANGNVLLVIGIIAWTLSYIRKHNISLPEFTDTLIHGVLMGIASYGILHAYSGHAAPGLTLLKVPATLSDNMLAIGLLSALPAIESIIALLLLMILWVRRRPLGCYADVSLAAPLLGTAGMVISFFHIQESRWLGLSLIQWFYVLLLLMTFLVFRAKEGISAEKVTKQAAEHREQGL